MMKNSMYFIRFQRVCGRCKQTRVDTEWTFELLSEPFLDKVVRIDVTLALIGSIIS
jgi:hypothetical protein